MLGKSQGSTRAHSQGGDEEHPSWEVLGVQQAACPYAPVLCSTHSQLSGETWINLAFLSAVCTLVGVFKRGKYLD